MSLTPRMVEKSVVARLEHKVGDVRWAAIEALKTRSKLSEAILLSVSAQLADEDWGVQRGVIEILCEYSALAGDVLVQVVALLEHRSRDM
jgi:hypothetical protein